MGANVKIALGLFALLLCGCTCHAIGEEPKQLNENVGQATVTHESGFAFPNQLGEFTRVDVHNYDEHGSDMSAGYNSNRDLIAATIYVYPVASVGQRFSLHDHMTDLRMDIVDNHPKATSTKPIPITHTFSGKPRVGEYATFAYTEPFAGKARALKGELYLFHYKAYFVKYRATYPAANAKTCAASVQRFMHSIAWPSE